MKVLRRSLVRLIPHLDQESFTQHLPTRQPPLWFIEIALKLGAQLSISDTKSLVWLGCDSNSQPSVLVANTLPLHYQTVNTTDTRCIDKVQLSLKFWWNEDEKYTTFYSHTLKNKH